MVASETAILNWLTARQGDMTRLLEHLVNIDSGSYDKPGVDRVGARLSEFLAGHGISTAVLPVSGFGDTLLAGTPAVRRDAGRHNVLLMGHRDTVFGEGEASRRPFRIAGDRAFGPGVADMKAGLVMNVFVLAAFQRFAPQVPVAVLMTGDEEIGSQASIDHIIRQASFARGVFNAEPARPTGNFVRSRKGGFTYRFEITGKDAHAGVNFTEGVSAIEVVANQILQLHALTDVASGITLNVGLVNGGSSTNTVAAFASAELDVRFRDNAQRDRLVKDIEAILNAPVIPAAKVSYAKTSESLPLAPTGENLVLSRLYAGAARSLGFDIDCEDTGGCADSGIASSAGAPTVCATGPVGGKAHTEDEYVLVKTLSERAMILARSISTLAG